MGDVSVNAAAAIGVAAAVATWVIGWAAKHVLDRTILRFFLDRWAKRSEKKALKRASWLLWDYKDEARAATDVRFTVLKAEQRVADRMLFLVSFIGLILGMLIWELETGHRDYRQITILAFPITLFILYLVQLRSVHHSYWRHVNRVNNLAQYREEVVERLRGLLAAAGMNSRELEKWLEKMPLPSGFTDQELEDKIIGHQEKHWEAEDRAKSKQKVSSRTK